MIKKYLVLIMAILTVLSVYVPGIGAFAADSGIKIQMFNNSTAATSNLIYPRFKIINTGNAAINLKDVKIRYYYTVDGEKAQNFWCDYAGGMIGNAYIDYTSKVTGQFVKMSRPVNGADYYLEIGFDSTAGTLPAGCSIELQTRFAKSDWTFFTQSNDYSFNSSATQYEDWTMTPVYIAGVLAYGIPADNNQQQTRLIPEYPEGSTAFDISKGPIDLKVKLTNTAGEGLPGKTITWKAQSGAYFQLGVMQAKSVTDSNGIAAVKIYVALPTSAEYKVITVDSYVTAGFDGDADYQSSTCNAKVYGKFTLGYLAGDVNGDGAVNSIDAGLLAGYLQDNSISIDKLAADMNNDGHVDSIDLELLLERIA